MALSVSLGHGRLPRMIFPPKSGRVKEAPLSLPWPSLSFLEPRRGDLMVLIGMQESYKSLFALNWAMSLQTHTVTLSMDTALDDQEDRIRKMLAGGRFDPRNRFYELFNPSMEDLDELVLAEKELWDSTPSLLVVDNVSDMVRSFDYADFRTVFRDLHQFARTHDLVVLALTHSHRARQGDLAQSGLYGGEHEAPIVLHIERNSPSARLSVVKNRRGKSDRNGSVGTTLWVREDLTMSETKPWYV